MKKILLIILLPLAAKSQIRYFHNPVLKISNYKNPRFIDADTGYAAFGFIENTSTPVSAQNRFTLFSRIGTGHLTGGDSYMRYYYPLLDIWGPWQLVESGTPDVRDSWGGRLRNIDNIPGHDSLILFLGRSLNGIGGSGPSKWSIDNYMLRGNIDGTKWSSRIPFDYGNTPKLERGYWFGHLTPGANPGTYFMEMNQWNQDTGNLTRNVITVIKTTDWFRHYSIKTVWDGNNYRVTEGHLAYHGNGKLSLFLRLEYSSDMEVYESSDEGETWMYRSPASPLYSYNSGTGVEVPFAWNDTIRNKFFVLYNNRDDDWITISRDNTVVNNFGNAQATYNLPEMYYWNQSEDHAAANSSLGYPSMINIAGDSVFLICWTHETNDHRANYIYSRDNFQTRNNIPSSPTLKPSYVTNSGFRIDITGYSQIQLNNISYFMFDVSTSPDFSSFVTGQCRNPGWAHASLLKNVYWTGLWDNYNALNSGTIYYVRFKACNNLGCSAYTTTNITTTSDYTSKFVNHVSKFWIVE